ncbi:DEAD/DEAH box helicase [Saccharicrinis sp. FJH54]|uniref:DEAD/DEAH box helicase n=1 Tax=Saccharicrinis sp. FJH54 TaxID=3344665 RepID=UPI0035D3DCC6
MTFLESGLEPNVLRAIEELGFVTPTPIQAKTIPHLLSSDQDIVALAQTGTGKTAAFGLPIIHLVHTELKTVQALILCPTRELCIQIASDMANFSKYVPGLDIVSVYGGAPIGPQIKSIKSGAQIVVGTPGRTLDLINRGVLKVDIIQWVVFDEADEMLNMGFKEDLDEILKTTPPEKQTLLFSATMPAEISRIAKKYMTDALEFSVGKKNAGAENVIHEYYMVHARDRYSALKRIADMNPKIYGIVFCRTRQETKDVADHLINDGYNADALHGDLSQPQRDLVMNKFRQGHLHMLVATDVAARGLDVNDLTHVINYNLPDDPEVYVHRSGRTGRAGKNGVSVSIIHTREKGKIKQIERILNKQMEHKMVPGGRAICEKQLFNLVDTVENITVDDQQIDKYLPVVYKKLEWLSREDLIKRFLSVEFNRFLEYYKNAPDLNAGVKEERSEGGKSERRRGKSAKGGKRGNSNMSRLFLNVGSIDKLNPAKLIGMINDFTQVRNIEIGEIDIKKKYAFFEVDSSYESTIIKSFGRHSLKGRKLNVEVAQKIR